jgi:hypothetical protein
MKENSAALLGLLVCPLVAVLAAGLDSFNVPSSSGETGPIAWLGIFPIVYLFALMASIVLGGPSFLLGRKMDLIRWWSASITGGVVGLIMYVAIRLPNIVLSMHDIALYIVTGFVAGLVFWSIWRCRATA